MARMCERFDVKGLAAIRGGLAAIRGGLNADHRLKLLKTSQLVDFRTRATVV